MTTNKIKDNVDLNQAPVMFIEEVTDDEELKSVCGGETPPDSVLSTKIMVALENRGIKLPNDPNNPNILTEDMLSAFKEVSGN
ncbi:hypothetical protein [Nostoc sp. 'Lobaria pulmonaria (5183) cyanobiont']|uniref:hypothetical protein n=1 Tax=Nostoc sp. 'Lobaria pulmonaria (5183) cyanobiont' TaxID=1618022 RepID=UPI000CF317C1|nr:hypothetical protein [Nostoc sp. 'Lobaria pulmonaria (5183) cyanobiont']